MKKTLRKGREGIEEIQKKGGRDYKSLRKWNSVDKAEGQGGKEEPCMWRTRPYLPANNGC